MENAITALALFAAALGLLAVFFVKLGRLTFWKMAAYFPEQALQYVSNDPAWIVQQSVEPRPGEEFVGPFTLRVPTLGRAVKLYARQDQIEQSQQRFVDEHRELLPRHGFPYMSLLALAYPVLAILYMGKTPASPILVLGYGFANLGYLLGAATVIPGHFRVLGLDYRIQTSIAAIIFWLSGVVLSNVAT